MNLKEIGEFGFIERFKPLFQNLNQNNQIGIGDDCAIIPVGNNKEWVISTDMLIEEVHFLRSSISPYQLGYKSLAVNLSDIASMGAKPIASFLSIAIPTHIEVDYLDEFIKGYHDLSTKYNTPLLGGDTTKSLQNLAINVTVIGECAKGEARKRSDAQVNDIICTTGPLGDSAAGLQTILQKINSSENNRHLVNKHLQPEPQINEGLFLKTYSAIHAMMDISDGIASDLKHILKASRKSATIDIASLPISDVLTNEAQKQHWNATELALSGGEDYELLLTMAPESYERISKAFEEKFGKKLHCIGSIDEGEPEIKYTQNGESIEIHSSGFNHFKS